MGSRDLIFLSLFSLGTAVGCGDGDPDALSWGETPPSSKPFSVACTQKQGCGTAYNQCLADREKSCSTCYSNCDLETCSACVSACDRYTCTCDSTTTKSCEYRFPVPAERDETLYKACRSLWDRKIPGCVSGLSADHLCDVFSRVERSEMKASYECHAASPEPCASHPACSPPADAAFADKICTGVCSETERQYVSSAAGWLRAEVKAQVEACGDESTLGRDRSACVQAWMKMISGL